MGGFREIDVGQTTESLEATAKIIARYGRELGASDVHRLDEAARSVSRAIAYEAIRLGLEGWKVVRTDEKGAKEASNPGSEDA